jgi:hypothetical protein
MLIRWLAGLAGMAGVLGLLRRRRAPAVPETATHPAEPDPAAALRRKLDEARTQPGPAAPPPQADAQPQAEADEAPLEERRARLHAKAHEAIESMRVDG